MNKSTLKLNAILDTALEGRPLAEEENAYMLAIKDAARMKAIFKTACKLRKRYFGDTIFLYGFLYTSTYCKNDCTFCYFRKSNDAGRRYRKDDQEIVDTACRLAESGVHLIDLTMGEDPAYLVTNGAGNERLVRLVKAVAHATGLPVMISPGVVPDAVLKRLADAGATWYACYQETHQRALFARLRPNQDYDVRLEGKRTAHRLGLLFEEGLLRGVGESAADVAASIRAMKALDADQIRVMNFVPQKGTPMQDHTPPKPYQEFLTTAVLRLNFPDRLIPASLDVDGLAGLQQRLYAGANVVTSLVPPGQGLAGVAQNLLDIEEGNRTYASVLPVLAKCGLKAASPTDYRKWIRQRQVAIGPADSAEALAC